MFAKLTTSSSSTGIILARERKEELKKEFIRKLFDIAEEEADKAVVEEKSKDRYLDI